MIITLSEDYVLIPSSWKIISIHKDNTAADKLRTPKCLIEAQMLSYSDNILDP